MSKISASSTKRRQPELSSSQEDATPPELAEKEGRTPKAAKTARTPSNSGGPSILAHFRKMERQDSVTSMASSDDVGRGGAAGDSDVEQPEEQEPTLKDVMRMLHTINAAVNNRLDKLTTQVEQLEGQVFDLQVENRGLTKKLEAKEKREEELKTKGEEAHYFAKLAEQRSNQTEQYDRLWNLKILYVPEKGGERPESPVESEEHVLRVFHTLLGLRHIKPEHIDACHRIGERKPDNARPIIVRFVSRKTRQEVLQARRKLKGAVPKVLIVDDLTKSNYTLFRATREHPGALRSWTRDGRIYAQSHDFKTIKINSLADLSQLSVDADNPLPASQPRQRRVSPRRREWSAIFQPGGNREMRGERGRGARTARTAAARSATQRSQTMETRASPV